MRLDNFCQLSSYASESHSWIFRIYLAEQKLYTVYIIVYTVYVLCVLWQPFTHPAHDTSTSSFPKSTTSLPSRIGKDMFMTIIMKPGAKVYRMPQSHLDWDRDWQNNFEGHQILTHTHPEFCTYFAQLFRIYRVWIWPVPSTASLGGWSRKTPG